MTDHTARIAALEEALASGELTIEVNGKKTTYRSTAELITALNYFKEQRGSAPGATGYGVTLATWAAD